jgi:predicted acylesterase/phospholipase RssA
MIYGFFYENSLYDATPVYKFLAEYFKDHEARRHISLGITNILNGQFKSFKGHRPAKDIVKVLQASISYPGVFKEVDAFDALWVTGAAIYEIDVLSLVRHCKEIGYADKDIVIDAIVTGDPALVRKPA